jgi:hypothetical protein
MVLGVFGPLPPPPSRGRPELVYLLLSHSGFSEFNGLPGLCGVDKLPFARETADVERFPPGGHTCLCAAVVRGDDSIVTMLLHWGASVNALGKKEQSPLVIAARAGAWCARVA